MASELHRLSLQGEWDAMATLIDDEILNAFAVVATTDKLAAALKDRCDGVIDRVMPSFPRHPFQPTPSPRYCTSCVDEEPPMSTPTMDDAAKVLADPQAYADETKLHAALTHLRANAPVSRVEVRELPSVLGHHQACGRLGHRAQ